MVPQPQIYIARHNLKNLAAPMSILNITVPVASRIKITRHGRVSYGSSRSASIFINAGGPRVERWSHLYSIVSDAGLPSKESRTVGICPAK
jgi:hypothetical protein